MMLKVDGVFAGGGIKAFSFVGALRILEREGISFERLAGTSAGAIIASLVSAGYNSGEIEAIFDALDLRTILDPKYEDRNVFYQLVKWISLYRKMGLYNGHYLERWLSDVLAQKGVVTFGDLPPHSLKMIAADVANSELIVIPDDLPKYGLIQESFPIAKAIRISCSIPFFFQPVSIPNKYGKPPLLIDGGILSNFPIWLFVDRDRKQERPFIGFRLNESHHMLPPRKIKNAFSLLHSTVETMWKAHDQRYISKSVAKNIVFIPVENTSPIQFSLSNEEKESLIHFGEKQTEEFLRNWTF